MISGVFTTTHYGSLDTNSAIVSMLGGEKSNYTRGLMNFDVSGYPGSADGSDIVSAKIVLELLNRFDTGEQLNFDRIKGHPDTDPADWVEAEVIWEEYSSGNAWTAFGGDLDATDRVTFLVPATAGTYDVTGFKDMVVDALANADRGDLLSVNVRLDDEADAGNTRGFAWSSREDPNDPSRQPALELTYGAATYTGARALGGVI